MSRSIHIRAFAIADYAAAHEFWSSIEGIGLNESDTPEAIRAFLDRNPDFSAAALDSNGEIVGTILCGHNGRAGSINHLAVAIAYRKNGIGKRLIEYAFAKLAEANIPRCNVFVYNDNDGGNGFWLNNGWNDPTTWRVLQKHVRAQIHKPKKAKPTHNKILGIQECMQLASGTVVDGRIVMEGDVLPEGTVVTILARERDETFSVPPELDTERLESMAEADRGETVAAAEVLRALRTTSTGAKRMTATCACGQASITVNALPIMHGVCHCTNCKRRTGSAFGISAYFDMTAIIRRSGETKVYAFHHTPQNHDQERHFCATCGTTLFWFVSSAPEKIGIASGCFADGGLPDPTYSVTDRKKESWVSLPPHWIVWTE